jgi:hypothetical protein
MLYFLDKNFTTIWENIWFGKCRVPDGVDEDLSPVVFLLPPAVGPAHHHCVRLHPAQPACLDPAQRGLMSSSVGIRAILVRIRIRTSDKWIRIPIPLRIRSFLQ